MLGSLIKATLVVALVPFLIDLPAQPSVRAEELLTTGAAPNARVERVDGRETVIATAGRAEDPALILIHGFGGSTFGWRNVMEPLAASGWFVVALDLPGFGLAEKRWGWPYDHRSQAKFVVAVMDQLSISTAVVAGHSMGGNVATWLAELEPERVRGLVLIDAAIATGSSGSPTATLLQLPPVRRAAQILIRSAFSEATFGELLSSAFAVKSAATPDAIRGYAAASQLAEWDAALLGIIRDGSKNALPRPIANIISRNGTAIPTLILWGSDDTWVPIEAGETLHANLSAATYQVLPGLGHVPFEQDPEAFTLALQDWLDALQ